MNPTTRLGKKGADPLMARANMEPMITISTASKAVFPARERLLLSRTITKVVRKTITPRKDTCRTVNSFGSTPRPSNISIDSENVFILKHSITEKNFHDRIRAPAKAEEKVGHR